jgi:hypothetical protein
MPFVYARKRKNPPQKRMGAKGFPDGWNSLPHASSLKDTELAELINGVYSQYGSISKRQGSQLLGAKSAQTGATHVVAGGVFYDIDGTDYWIRVLNSGHVEKYNFSTNTWSLLTGTPPSGYSDVDPQFVNDSPIFDTTVHINIVQANGKIYFASSLDRVVIFDGSAWHVYNEIADPTGYATVTKTGSGTGTRTYYYRWVELNEFGHTAGSPDTSAQSEGTGWYGSMPVIDGGTYLTITLPAAPAGTTRRAIYRGDTSGNEFFLAEIDASETVYIDKNINPQGEEGTSVLFPIPDENTTPGYHFYLLATYANSLVGTTVEEGKDVLVWSAGAGTKKVGDSEIDTFDSFSLEDGAGFDGYQQGDGQSINALQPFSVANNDGLAVFKDARVGLLEFDAEGGGNVQNVNVIRGTMSPHSPHVAGNNIRFWSSEGVASLGHEENYGTILRYTVMSLKADAIAQRVTPANLPLVCSEYHKNLSIFGISTGEAGAGNDSMLVYDERYNTWSYFTGLHASILFKGIHPTTKVESLYFGTSSAVDPSIGGSIVEMFKGKTDYSTSTGTGNKITLSLTTKQWDANLPDQFKKFDKAVLIFGSLFGNNTTVQAFYMDANGVGQFPRYRIATDPVLSGFGNDEWGTQEIGMMTDDDTGETLNIRYINLRQRDLFWSKLNVQNDGIDDEMTLIGIALYYSPSNRQLPSRARLRTLA